MSRSIVVIGNFDGVHTGHAALLRHAQSLDPSLPLVVVTFWPHPMAVLRPGGQPRLLTTLNGRIELLKQAGAAEVRVVQFTRDVSVWSPEEFVTRILGPLQPAHVVVGTNFRFGYRAAGDVEVLRAIGARQGFAVDAVALVETDGETTCSSLVREALEQGDVAGAARQLGRPFRVQGVVIMGDQRGRELGFPTANLPVQDEMAVPADGVYAGWLTRLDRPEERMPAAISVGSNPTFQGMERRVETYVLDRDDLELYGVEIAVDFVERLRGQVTFTGIEGLVAQMTDDVARTRQVLG